MSLIRELFSASSVAGTVLVLSLVTALGLAIGSVKVRGVGLGIAGVLFAGIGFGHFGVRLDEHLMHFVREFGLILFVYTIGMQVGPGFLASLRRAGLPLNIAAAAIVLMGAGIAVALHLVMGVPTPAAVGLFSGATTNTPSLAAAQEAVKQVVTDPIALEQAASLPGVGYAVAYPFGVMGIILSLLVIRRLFRVDLPQEERVMQSVMNTRTPAVMRVNLEVTNANLAGVALADVPTLGAGGVVVSRLWHAGELSVPMPETVLAMGDVLLAVGTQEELERLRMVVGRESTMDLRTLPSSIESRRIVVTRRAALGKSIAEIDYVRRLGVVLSRIDRAGVELPVTPDLHLQYGDRVIAVGEGPALDKAAAELGNAPKQLDHPQVIPMFLGIALGVLVGSIPFNLPGVPAPVKLGLAGGPLVVAIILSRIGKVGPLVWYMPRSANYMVREIGIVLFLACVGLKSGERFIDTLVSGPGLEWMAYGAIITVVPLMIVALVMRIYMRTNYLMLCGLLAGSMTDPPALAFANQATGSESPSLAYATVYPLTMILRVLCAQLIVLLFM